MEAGEAYGSDGGLSMNRIHNFGLLWCAPIPSGLSNIISDNRIKLEVQYDDFRHKDMVEEDDESNDGRDDYNYDGEQVSKQHNIYKCTSSIYLVYWDGLHAIPPSS